MRMRMIAAVVFGAAIGVGVMHVGTRAQQTRKDEFKKEDYVRWMKEMTNWGRWGKNDEIGAMNLITPAKMKQAASLVKSGVSVSLAEIEYPNQDPPDNVFTGAPY